MARIVFFCHVKSPDLLQSVEFYRQDIAALESLGHEVVVCTKWREIPRRFDAIFVWWWTHAAWPCLMARICRRPCLITGVFNFRYPAWQDGRDYFRRPAWQRWLLRLVMRGCTMNLFLSQHELIQCSDFFNVSNGRYLPLSLAEEYLRGPAEKREKAVLNIAWCQRSNLIRKGIPELVHAVRILKDRGITLPVYLAGHEGDGQPYLKELIETHGVSDTVHVLGEVSLADKLNLLRTCEVYVQPSRYEGFGLAMAEAMGCGASVVTCDVGAVREVVGDAGVYVAPGSAEELADGLQRVVRDAAEREVLREKAVQRARQLFSTDSKLQRMAGYLLEAGISSRAIGGRSRGSVKTAASEDVQAQLEVR